MDYHVILNELAHQDWQAFATFIGGAGVISVGLQYIKHVAGSNWGHKFVAFLLAITSFAVSFANLWLSSGFKLSHDVLPVLGQHTADLTSLAFFIYHLSVNPLYVGKVKPFLEKLAIINQELAAEKGVTVPAGLPEVAGTQQFQ